MFRKRVWDLRWDIGSFRKREIPSGLQQNAHKILLKVSFELGKLHIMECLK